MPPGIIKFAYSKKSAYAVLLVLVVLISLLLKTCISSFMVQDMFGGIIFAVFALAVFALLVLMIITRLIPAMRGDVALELDENGIRDHIRNIIIDWKDIEDNSRHIRHICISTHYALKDGHPN